MKVTEQKGALLDPGKWDQFIRSQKGTNIYQESAWLRLLETLENLEPYHITLMNAGNIIAAFPNFRKSRGWDVWDTESLPKGYGGPVLGRFSEKLMLDLFASFEENNRSVRHLIRISGSEAVGLSKILSRLGYRPQLTDSLPVIDLSSGLDAGLKGITGANRRDIKRAEKHGLDIDDSVLRDSDLVTFYKLYIETMNSIEATSSMELNYFRDIAELYGNDARLTAAYSEGKMIAARLHLIDRTRLRILFTHSVSSMEGKKKLAGSALHRFSIRWGVDHGFLIYDMGSTLADHGDGLFKYKVNWGAKPCFAPCWIKIRKPALFRTLSLIRKVVKRLHKQSRK